MRLPVRLQAVPLHDQIRAIAGALLLGLSLPMPAALAQDGQPTQYRNEKYGFSLTIPPELIRSAPGIEDVGGIWISADATTRLLAVAGPNTTGDTLTSYRRFVMQQSYKNARLDYAPVRGTWFVLSGTMDGKMFYERITLACGGRYIYGWQLTYPIGERARWDRVVEAIHRSYRAGRGEDGRCGRAGAS